MKIEITDIEKEILLKVLNDAYFAENANCYKYGDEYDNSALMSVYVCLIAKLKRGAK